MVGSVAAGAACISIRVEPTLGRVILADGSGDEYLARTEPPRDGNKAAPDAISSVGGSDRPVHTEVEAILGPLTDSER